MSNINAEMDEVSRDGKTKTTYNLDAGTMDFTLLDDSIKADFNCLTSN